MPLVFGRLVAPAEEWFGRVWSACEVGLALTRFDELRRDPYWAALLEDIEARGFHPPIEGAPELAIEANGLVRARNPYRRVAPHEEEHVVAWLQGGKPGPRRTLLVVCHCYGLPVPRVMGGLFGLEKLPVDVVYNILPHHQRGTFSLWPGSGFARVRISRFVENLRAAATAVRALIRGLRGAGRYERVVVLGFSLGGQIALHTATAESLDGLVLYCPVTSLRSTALELGLMKAIAPPLRRSLSRLGRADVFEDLAVTEPLRYPIRVSERNIDVIVQRFDALAPPHQIEPIRAKYRDIGWHVLDGTHVYPAGLTRIRSIVRRAALGSDA